MPDQVTDVTGQGSVSVGTQATSPDQSNVTPQDTNQGQAGAPSTGTSNQTQPWEVERKNLLSGMNRAQEETAAWRKSGFQTPEEAAQAAREAEEYRQLKSNPFPQIAEILKTNPQQAAILFGQVFNNNPPQDPNAYPEEMTYEQWGDITQNQAVKKVNEQLDPRISKLEQFIYRQDSAAVQAEQNQIYPAESHSDLWSLASKAQLNPDIIRGTTNPTTKESWMMNGLFLETQGGRKAYEEKIRADERSKLTQQVNDKRLLNNQSVATVTPSGGVNTNVIPEPFTDPDKRLAEARRLAALTP